MTIWFIAQTKTNEMKRGVTNIHVGATDAHRDGPLKTESWGHQGKLGSEMFIHFVQGLGADPIVDSELPKWKC